MTCTSRKADDKVMITAERLRSEPRACCSVDDGSNLSAPSITKTIHQSCHVHSVFHMCKWSQLKARGRVATLGILCQSSKADKETKTSPREQLDGSIANKEKGGVTRIRRHPTTDQAVTLLSPILQPFLLYRLRVFFSSFAYLPFIFLSSHFSHFCLNLHSVKRRERERTFTCILYPRPMGLSLNGGGSTGLTMSPK